MQLTDDILDEIRQHRAEGVTYQKLSDTYHVSISRLVRICKDVRPPRNQSVTTIPAALWKQWDCIHRQYLSYRNRPKITQPGLYTFCWKSSRSMPN